MEASGSSFIVLWKFKNEFPKTSIHSLELFILSILLPRKYSELTHFKLFSSTHSLGARNFQYQTVPKSLSDGLVPVPCLPILSQFHVSMSGPGSMSYCTILFHVWMSSSSFMYYTVLSQFHVWPFFSNFMFNCHMTQCQILPQVQGHFVGKILTVVLLYLQHL